MTEQEVMGWGEAGARVVTRSPHPSLGGWEVQGQGRFLGVGNNRDKKNGARFLKKEVLIGWSLPGEGPVCTKALSTVNAWAPRLGGCRLFSVAGRWNSRGE